LKEEIVRSWNLYRLGDNEALKGVYMQYYAELLIYAKSLTKETEDSKDLVASVFLKLFNFDKARRAQLPTGNDFNLSAYLRVSIKNRFLDSIKRDTVRSDFKQTIINRVLGPFTRPKVEDSFAENNFREMMDVLPKAQRQVLQLHLDGYDHHEIGKQLNITYNTSRNQLSSAKNKIKALWSTFMD